MSLRLVIFDCDGTLVDSQYVIVQAMQAAFLGSGLIAPQPAMVKRVVGLSLEVAVQRLRPELDTAATLAISERYRQAFHQLRLQHGAAEPMYEGVKAALSELDRAGYLLGVATGKGRRGLAGILEHHGLAERFVTLQTADDVTAGKPAPDMCLRACAEAGVAPADAIVIGDTSYDMEMARRAGARAIGVTWGYHPPAELERAGAVALVSRADEIRPAVDRLFALELPA